MLTMNSLALRLYTVVVALVCGGAIAYTIDQQHQAATWQTELAGWQQLAARTVKQNRLANHRVRILVHRYNKLVVATNASQRRLLSAAKKSAAASTYTASSSYVSSGYSSGGAAPTAVSAPAPAPVAAPAPTTAVS
jgi:hypothetical protein